MLFLVHLAINGVQTLVVICTDYTGSCKSNYHTTTATTAPMNCRKTDVERQTVNAYSQINKDNKIYKIKPPTNYLGKIR
jgi:hypothetical protein